MSAQPKVNMVKLSGIVKRHMCDEESGFILLDPQTEESRFIACTVFKEKDLARKLATFQEDDYIQINGFIRAWSKKLAGGKYENRVEVRITHIANEGTAKSNPRKKSNKNAASDDDLPWW